MESVNVKQSEAFNVKANQCGTNPVFQLRRLEVAGVGSQGLCLPTTVAPCRGSASRAQLLAGSLSSQGWFVACS